MGKQVVDGDGYVQERGWDGEYRPKQGFFGPVRETDWLGNPKVERDLFGNPKAETDWLGNQKTSASGQGLFSSGSSSGSGGSGGGIEGAVGWLLGMALFGVFMLLFWLVRALFRLCRDEPKVGFTLLAVLVGVSALFIFGIAASPGASTFRSPSAVQAAQPAPARTTAAGPTPVVRQSAVSPAMAAAVPRVHPAEASLARFYALLTARDFGAAYGLLSSPVRTAYDSAKFNEAWATAQTVRLVSARLLADGDTARLHACVEIVRRNPEGPQTLLNAGPVTMVREAGAYRVGPSELRRVSSC